MARRAQRNSPTLFSPFGISGTTSRSNSATAPISASPSANISSPIRILSRDRVQCTSRSSLTSVWHVRSVLCPPCSVAHPFHLRFDDAAILDLVHLAVRYFDNMWVPYHHDTRHDSFIFPYAWCPVRGRKQAMNPASSSL